MVISLTQLKASDKITIPGKGRAVAVLKNGLVQFACDASDNVDCTIEIEPIN